jgi:hypothetical protein
VVSASLLLATLAALSLVATVLWQERRERTNRALALHAAAESSARGDHAQAVQTLERLTEHSPAVEQAARLLRRARAEHALDQLLQHVALSATNQEREYLAYTAILLADIPPGSKRFAIAALVRIMVAAHCTGKERALHSLQEMPVDVGDPRSRAALLAWLQSRGDTASASIWQSLPAFAPGALAEDLALVCSRMRLAGATGDELLREMRSAADFLPVTPLLRLVHGIALQETGEARERSGSENGETTRERLQVESSVMSGDPRAPQRRRRHPRAFRDSCNQADEPLAKSH